MKKRVVVVIGDVMLDEYVTCDVSRIEQTAPVPICAQKLVRRNPGGAANVAVNIAALGVPVVLIGAVPKQEDQLKHLLTMREQTSPTFYFRPVLTRGRYTVPVKQRIVDDSGQLIVRIDRETPPAWDLDEQLQQKCQQVSTEFDTALVVLSDYAKGLLSAEAISTTIARCVAGTTPVIVDPVPVNIACYEYATMLTPNIVEAREMSDLAYREHVDEMADHLRKQYDVESVLLTLGACGAYYCDQDDVSAHLPVKQMPTADTTGAGDTLVAGVAAALYDGADLLTAAKYGVAAATVAVQRHGTTVVGKHDVYRMAMTDPQDKIMPIDRAAELMWAASWGGKPVVTNGVFDLLHRGHHNLLTWARTRGDFLTVLVNSDRSARPLKGAGRPIQDERMRAVMVASHPAVDAVCLFDGPTPKEELQKLGACHLVKGPGYTLDQVIDRQIVEEAGGLVSVMPKGSVTDELSTTKTIVRVQRCE